MVKILVVDDENDILESVGMLVETLGYEAVLANGGKRALTLLKKEKFDLILLDILMPKMSGLEVLKQIRADSSLKDQKVVFLSVVSPSRNGKSTIQELNPLDYIEKPVDNADFKKKIKKIFEK